jgi:hypothetical protein
MQSTEKLTIPFPLKKKSTDSKDDSSDELFENALNCSRYFRLRDDPTRVVALTGSSIARADSNCQITDCERRVSKTLHNAPIDESWRRSFACSKNQIQLFLTGFALQFHLCHMFTAKIVIFRTIKSSKDEEREIPS